MCFEWSEQSKTKIKLLRGRDGIEEREKPAKAREQSFSMNPKFKSIRLSLCAWFLAGLFP